MISADYIVVGSGLTGATIARQLADAGRDVVVIDRRPHAGGNVHDHTHQSGAVVHTYGPHYFRTSSDHIWAWAHRFGAFLPYEARVMTQAPEGPIPWPLHSSYIEKVAGAGWRPGFCGSPSNLEEAALSLMPESIYHLFVKEYNEKQWGISPLYLPAALCRRFDVRSDGDDRLSRGIRHQGIPAQGYAAWTASILQGIPLHLGTNYQTANIKAVRRLVFTGPIDEFFGFKLGRLQYRGQQREHVWHDSAGPILPAAQLNTPRHCDGPQIRRIEWAQIPSYSRAVRGTVVTTETPYSPVDPAHYEYPIPDDRNARLYSRYRELAAGLTHTTICGRLGEYRYIDMDQAVARAMATAARILRADP